MKKGALLLGSCACFLIFALLCFPAEMLAASAEGVQHSVSREGKHFYQTVGKLQGEGGRVTILCGGSWHFPYLAEPILKIFLWNLAVDALLFCRLSVSAGFSFHQDIFHIVFDDGVGLIGFS